MSRGIQLEQSVLDGDRMPLRPFLVAEVRVGDPELFPAAVVQTNLGLVLDWRECQPRVAPRLSEVHAYTVVLEQLQYTQQSQCFSHRSLKCVTCRFLAKVLRNKRRLIIIIPGHRVEATKVPRIDVLKDVEVVGMGGVSLPSRLHKMD